MNGMGKVAWLVGAWLLSIVVIGCDGGAGKPNQTDGGIDLGTGGDLGASGDAAANPAQARVDAIAHATRVGFVVVENVPSKEVDGGSAPDCPESAPWGLCFDAKLTLTNSGSAWSGGGWAIYFSSVRKVLSVANPEFTITHVNGDLHRLEPTAQFSGFAAGETKEIPFQGEYWMISESDVMPRFYVTADGAQATVISNTDGDDSSGFVTPLTTPEQTRRTPGDQTVMATAATRYAANLAVTDVGAAGVAAELVPAPALVTPGAGTLDLAAGIALSADVLGAATVAAVTTRLLLFGVTVKAGGVPVKVTVDAQHAAFSGRASAEAYTLTIGANEVSIVGGDAAGAFYGLQTLVGLLPAAGARLPQLVVAYDAPRYPYRGAQIDIARNFHSAAELRKVIDQLAAYKLNTLHLHLSDDEGWRLEIPALPELTALGSVRCHDPSETRCTLPQLGSGPASSTSGSGHLTRADFIAILKAAQARHITVIPELDMPGHARAAIKSMELRAAAGDRTYLLSDPDDTSKYSTAQYYDDDAINPCLDSTFAFVAKVMDEVKAMYSEAGAPLSTWHVGADEVGEGAWTASPRCAALYAQGGVVESAKDVHGYFIRRVNGLAKARGLGIRGWSDGMKKGVVGPDGKPSKVFLDIGSDLDGNAASVNWWGTLFWWDNSAHALANLGYKVILTPPDFLYFDHPYEADPKERGYYWGTRFTDVKKLFSYMPANLPANAQLTVDRMGMSYTSLFVPTPETPAPVLPLNVPSNVVGLEGALWSETVRSDEAVDYMVFPRLLALAERAWRRGAWEAAAGIEFDAAIDKPALAADWQRFANVVGHKELPKLDKAGVAYRIEVPGAQIAGGKLGANVAFPGLTIEYRVPGGAWTTYDASAPPSLTAAEVRARTSDGRAGRAVAVP